MYVSTNYCIHVTSAAAVDSIMKTGLQPRIGPLSEQVEGSPAIYMFPDWESLEDANWLFESWPYDSEPALIGVNTTGLVLYSSQPYEVAFDKAIEPSRLKMLAPGEDNWVNARRLFLAQGGQTRAQQLSQSAKKGSKNFFSNARGLPVVLFHGTSADRKPFHGFTSWASQTPELAQEYAEMRANNGASEPLVIPVNLKFEHCFDANQLPDPVTITSFIDNLKQQYLLRCGHLPTQENCLEAQFSEAQKNLKALARREESGPYYSKHNFWHEPECFFGNDGAALLRELFRLTKFDAITLREHGQITYGVFDKSQIQEHDASFRPTRTPKGQPGM